jgi:hypothetical protein
VAALFYSLTESAKLADVESYAYLGAAAHAAVRDQQIALPHEFSACAGPVSRKGPVSRGSPRAWASTYVRFDREHLARSRA